MLIPFKFYNFINYPSPFVLMRAQAYTHKQLKFHREKASNSIEMNEK